MSVACPRALAAVREWLSQQAGRWDYFGVEGWGDNPKRSYGKKHKHIMKILGVT